MRGRTKRASTLALVVAAALLAPVAVSDSAIADDPTGCLAQTTHTWDGGGTTDFWGDALNWDTNTVPNDNPDGMGEVETSTTYVCIPAGSTVRVSGAEPDPDGVDVYVVQAFFLGAGAQLDLVAGSNVAAMSDSVESFAATGSSITVTRATLGGEGVIRTRGNITVNALPNGGATLSSKVNGDPTLGSPGQLIIDTGGELLVPNRGINIEKQLHITVHGQARVQGEGYLSAAYNTTFEITATGVLTFAGLGGYYQGTFDGPTNLSVLLNRGTIRKTGGGTSVIDANYQETGDGHLEVVDGTIAFPNGTTFDPVVLRGQQASTAVCAPLEIPAFPPGQTQPLACRPETDPTVDRQTISLRVPASARVALNERPSVDACPGAATGDYVFDSDGDAEGLVVNPQNPVVVTMRFAASCATQGIDSLTALRDGALLKSCTGTGVPPSGQIACVDRRGIAGQSSRIQGANAYMVVRTTQTSRWRIKKEERDLYAPTALTPSQKKGQLGRPVKVRTKFSEGCTVWGTAKVKANGVPRTLKVKISKKDGKRARAGAGVVLKFKLTRQQREYLEDQDAERGKATVTLKAVDSFGNPVRDKVKIKLR